MSSDIGRELREQLQGALGASYTLERELGGGGMSRTFLATEHGLARRVVVKALAPELLAGISVERFKREVQLAAGLQHPHVVPVLTTGDVNGLPWFTMPFVEGESLRQRLNAGVMPIGEITGVLRDVARALEFAHGRGIVHRDIKPDNILLAGSSATVTDFGIAKAVESARTIAPGTTAAGLTAAGMAIGTPAYMAPEQAAGDPGVDHRADIYAFGATAYELLTGRPPFEGAPSRVISAHFSETPRDVRELRPDTPASLASLVMSCLAKDPAQRPRDARALLTGLESNTSSERAGATPRSRLARALAVWALVAIVVVGFGWFAEQSFDVPGWTLPVAWALVIAGLFAIVATAFVHRVGSRARATVTPGGSIAAQGTIANLAVRAAPHVSWRRTWTIGGIAIGGFAASLVAFTVLRANGIGPFGSLRGAGTFGDRETLVVADFRSPASDSTLGATASEAIRTDLAQSANLKVMTRAALGEIQLLMGRSRAEGIGFDVARQIATREGAKAVLDGAIDRLGSSYVVSARLVASLDGRELATFRETASDDAELVASLGRLSRQVRGKVGESLREIRASQSLERVTTTSLPALRKYVEATTAISALGDPERGVALLQEAVAQDSTFAMAWRRLAATLAGGPRQRQLQLEAISRAYALRDRLSEDERLLTEASYFSYGPRPDLDKAIAANMALIARDSSNQAALNNAATRLFRKNELTLARDLLERATRAERPFGGAFTNLTDTYLGLGDIEGAERTLARFRKTLPQHTGTGYAEMTILAAKGELDSAARIGAAAFEKSTSSSVRDRAAFYTGDIAFVRGQLGEGLRWLRAGNSIQEGSAARQAALFDALDSAWVAAYWLEDGAASREHVRRALRRFPIESIAPSERPWRYLGQIAAVSRSPDDARAARDGWVRDTATAGSLPGEEAGYRFQVALAEGRYADAVTAAKDGQRRSLWPPRYYEGLLARAFDLAGERDSAIAHYEAFVKIPLSDLEADPDFLPIAYQRLAEMYDERGDLPRAERYYEAFVELWEKADPPLQPRVRAARERVAELRRRRG